MGVSKIHSKRFLLIPLLFFIIASGSLLFINADHDTVTKIVSSGDNTISIRDISNTSNSTQSISVDKTKFKTGDTLTITVTDTEANLNTSSTDSVTCEANTTTSFPTNATTTCTETGVNTATFSGQIILSSSSTTSGNVLQGSKGDNISVFYAAEPEGVSRLSASFSGLTTSPSVTLEDFIIDSSSKSDGLCPIAAATHPVKITATGQANTQPMTVTISYANALLNGAYDAGSLDPSLFPPSLLRMGYFQNPGDAVGVFTPGSHGLTVDTTAKTVTVTKTSAIFSATQSGHYFIGFNSGCAGGGGGGLVRPGLVVNALAGISAATGGSSGPPGPTVTLGALAKYDSAVERISMPQEIRDILLNHDPHTPLEPITNTYEDFDLPFSINGNGFALGNYENTLVTQTIQPGEPNEFVVVYYTNQELAHSSLNFNSATVHGSNVQLLLFNDKPPELVDPNGNIASFTGSINNEDDLKRVATFSATFSETAELSNPDMVIRSWTTGLSSGDTIIYDAIEIAQPEIVEIADEDIPEPEIQTLKSQYVPIWIKNNAAWWSQELIEDSDFVAGIEYLIQNEIITIQDDSIIAPSYSSNEIPEWIKNTAGWWSEDLITEKEFIDGLQWLISNGIVQVTET